MNSQIEKVNELVKDMGMTLKNEEIIEDVIGNVILGIKGKAMVIFYLVDDVCHAEAVKDGEVIDKDGSNIWKYEMIKAKVFIYRFLKENGDDVEDYEVDEIILEEDSTM